MPLKTKLLRLSLLSILAIGAIIGALFLVEYLSWKTIRFELSEATSSIAIYTTNPDTVSAADLQSIASRDGSGDVRLKPDTYYVIPSGERVIDDPITVIVTSETKDVFINPYLTSDYLSETFSSEVPGINAIIRDTYPSVSGGYTIDDGVFYHYGDWYATTLKQGGSATNANIETYGVILKKSEGKWLIAAKPALLFTYADHKHIPADVVYAANRAVNSQ